MSAVGWGGGVAGVGQALHLDLGGRGVAQSQGVGGRSSDGMARSSLIFLRFFFLEFFEGFLRGLSLVNKIN